MRQCFGGLCRAAILGLAIGVAAMLPAQAEMQVLESNVTAYPVGSRAPDDARFKLQAGDRVKVLLLPSNQTKVFEGSRIKGPGTAGGTRGAPKKPPE